jgi:hypothetical protein
MSEKTVYGKLFKSEQVDLSSEKVELGLLDDIKKDMKAANQGAMKAIDLANAAKKPAEQSLKLNKELFKKLTQAEKMAKDLGVTEAFKTINEQVNQVSKNIETIESVLDALYRI